MATGIRPYEVGGNGGQRLGEDNAARLEAAAAVDIVDKPHDIYNQIAATAIEIAASALELSKQESGDNGGSQVSRAILLMSVVKELVQAEESPGQVVSIWDSGQTQASVRELALESGTATSVEIKDYKLEAREREILDYLSRGWSREKMLIEMPKLPKMSYEDTRGEIRAAINKAKQIYEVEDDHQVVYKAIMDGELEMEVDQDASHISSEEKEVLQALARSSHGETKKQFGKYRFSMTIQRLKVKLSAQQEASGYTLLIRRGFETHNLDSSVAKKAN